jgi:hypothetical protein
MLQTEDTHYELRQLQVVVNSQQKNALFNSEYMKPWSSPNSIGEEMHSSSTKSGTMYGVSLNGAVGLKPQVGFEVNVMKTTEEVEGSETRRPCNAINAQFIDGKIQWDFDINDISSRKKGLFLPPNDLPTVRFEFIGKSHEDKLARPPENIDIAITSYWRISPSDQKGPWIRKLLDSFRLAGDTQTILSYSNLLQIVTLNPKLSELSKRVIHRATVKFKPGTEKPHEVIDDYAAPESVGVIPSVVCIHNFADLPVWTWI